MSSAGISSVAELLERIRAGMVPRSVRLFAAQGLLPVSREDLIRVIVLLVVEGDEEIAAAARQTLSTFDTAHFLAVLRQPDLEAIEIDLIARAVNDEVIWQEIVRDGRTANETLRALARMAPGATQDAIITNQMRIMGCLEILADLRANPQATPDVLRRAREFEEEFIDKAVVWATGGSDRPFAEEGPNIEEALSALLAIGMNLPGAKTEPERIDEPEESEEREIKDAFVRIALMNTFQRVMCALKGSKEERLILCRDRSPLVARAVASSPRLNDQEVEKLAGMRSINDECLRMIAGRGRWLRRYGVVRALAFNPKTPLSIGMQMLGRLADRDLGMLARDRNVAAGLRKAAFDRYTTRRK